MRSSTVRFETIALALIFLIVGAVLLSTLPDQVKWMDNRALIKQPRLWPAIALIGWLIFAICFVAKLGLRRDPDRPFRFDLRWLPEWAIPLEFCAWFMAYVYATPIVGYLPTTVLFCVALTARLGYRGRVLGWAALFAVAVVVFFKSLLQVKIPSGTVYQYLPDGLRGVFLVYF